MISLRRLRWITSRRQTRATRCITRIVLYTEVDAQCDKLADVVDRLLTVASYRQLSSPDDGRQYVHITPSVHFSQTVS